jgi:hypothetical protein
MAVAKGAIEIRGLAELQRSLKAIDGQSQKKLRLVLNKSVEVISEGVQRLVPMDSGSARASVKNRSTQREARIRAGGNKAPYYPWLDFGGSVGRSNSVKRAFFKNGRYLYPTFDRRRAWFYNEMGKGLTKLIEESGLDVK